MAKIFINNLNTYVGQTIFKTIRPEPEEGEEPSDDGPMYFGTYIDKDSSEKPSGIKKMLKVRLRFPKSFPRKWYHLKRKCSKERKTQIDDEIFE